MNKLQSVTTITPDGEFHIIINEKGVAQASGFGDMAALTQRLPEALRHVEIEPAYNHPYERFVEEYYDGNPTALDEIPREQAGTELQRDVWNAIASVAYGDTVSYKTLAGQAGHAAAIRATGTICGLNRLILLIPCHRVLKSDGSIGNYLYGAKIKESLLRREGAI